MPTNKLYPFQWNWDSGFTSLGHSYFSLDRAMTELESLFSAQWQNGMVPHIVFHSENEKTYFPNYDFWGTEVNAGAPQKPKSSGITQPAVHGFVLENLLAKFPDSPKLHDFVRHLFPKVVDSHRFLYTHRDPGREGLMYIFHPWESGRDNSPLWDGSMNRIEIKPGELPEYKRRDTALASADERPTSAQYDRYVYLLLLGKKYEYDKAAIFSESPFVVQDTLMNAVLIKSNQGLINIGKRFGFDVAELEEWQSQSVPAFNEKLWNEELKTYTCFDVRTDEHIALREIGGITPLFAKIPDADKAKHLNDYLQNLHERNYFLCPSFDVDHPLFDSKRYWRGPIWPQMNWLIYHGLKEYGHDDTAETVKSDLIALVGKLGFYEYFESQKKLFADLKTGYGGGDFSWTAACVLDLLNE